MVTKIRTQTKMTNSRKEQQQRKIRNREYHRCLTQLPRSALATAPPLTCTDNRYLEEATNCDKWVTAESFT